MAKDSRICSFLGITPPALLTALSRLDSTAAMVLIHLSTSIALRSVELEYVSSWADYNPDGGAGLQVFSGLRCVAPFFDGFCIHPTQRDWHQQRISLYTFRHQPSTFSFSFSLSVSISISVFLFQPSLIASFFSSKWESLSPEHRGDTRDPEWDSTVG